MPLFIYITDEHGYNTGHADGNKYLAIELHVDHERIGRVILDYQGNGSYDVSYEKNDGTPSRLIDCADAPEKCTRRAPGENAKASS